VTVTKLKEDQSEAAGIHIQDDGTGAKRLLWDMARDATKPEVVACSEWP
jgi:hypothetical protein